MKLTFITGKVMDLYLNVIGIFKSFADTLTCKKYPPRDKPVSPFVIETYSKRSELPVTYYTVKLAL